MNEKQYRRDSNVQTSMKLIAPFKKGVSLFGTTMMLTAAVIPAFAAKVEADEMKELEPKVLDSNEVNQGAVEQSTDSTTEQSATQESTSNQEIVDSTETSAVAKESETNEVENELSVDSEAAKVSQDDSLVEEVPSDVMSASMMRRGISPNVFIEQVGSQAQTVAAANNLYASVMIAQAILESAWGGSALASAPNHNLFGIKGSYNGQYVNMSTKEVINGKWVTQTAKFRKYPSYSESLLDNAYVLKNTSFQAGVYFYSGAWKSNTRSYRDATAWLTGRYATDPGYSGKLNKIIENNNLTRFDTPGSGTGNSGNNSNNGNNGGSTGGNTGNGNITAPGTGTYTVVSGDTLFGIARKYGVTVANLKSWNQLTSDVIYVGQSLVVKASNTGNNSNTGGNTGNNSTQPSAGDTHTVVSGDTLSAIARRYGVTVANLKSWNSLSSDLIRVGQKLKVKGSAGGSNNTGNSGGNATAPSAGTTHTIVSGDTLSSIARKYGVTVANLKSWNNLTSDLIYVGQKLNVKAASGGSSTTAPSSGATYTIVSGDTLSGIARKYGVTVANLKSWNGLTSDLIHVGQKLTVKNTGGSSNTGNSGNNTTPPSTGNTYTIASGDTLSSIARKYGVTVANLKTWNNLTSDLIYVGQKLSVKGAGGSNNTTSSGNTASSNGTSYTVVSGDTLSSIARKYRTTVANVKAWNNLSSDLIYVGQKLSVKGTANGASSNTNASNSATTGSYTVRAGDTLTGIASRHGVSVANLKSWNSLTSDTIYVGQKLAVKGSGAGHSTTATNKTHKVVSGDTLWSIAEKNNVTVKQLVSWNNLKGDAIYIGQTLRVK